VPDEPVPEDAAGLRAENALLRSVVEKAGFGDAMTAALAAEDVLAADETPVNVLGTNTPQAAARDEEEEADPEEKEKPAAGAPHVLIVRTPDGRPTFLQAIGSRRKDAIAAGIPGLFTGALIGVVSVPSAPQLEGGARGSVLHRGSHLQIIASAGSGKTEVVAQRFVQLMAGGADPAGIIAFTFTKRAADELKARISARVKERLGKLIPLPELGDPFKAMPEKGNQLLEEFRLWPTGS
jgi:UvrD/REP helicase N-terminal domain